MFPAELETHLTPKKPRRPEAEAMDVDRLTSTAENKGLTSADRARNKFFRRGSTSSRRPRKSTAR